jgi:hypothetical protein
MTQLATVERRKGEYLVCSFSKTTPGFWVMNGLFRRLPGDVDDDSLGDAVSWALDFSTEGVNPPPLNGPSPFMSVLLELGLASYGQYMKGASSVGIRREGDRLTVTPKHNGGPRAGFTEIHERVQNLDTPNPTALAIAIRVALEATS